jgi:hypothetical protein
MSVTLWQTINPFSSSATDLSICHLMIMCCTLPSFALYSPWHHVWTAHTWTYGRNFYFLTSLCTSCLCTVGPL